MGIDVPSHWFVFGESADGTVVDVADSNGDVLQGVPRNVAERVIEEFNRLAFFLQDADLPWETKCSLERKPGPPTRWECGGG
jgi:hypothetical protein